ncbi:MAG: DUF3048 domain-containing protein [Acidimicrobiales bacterium]|nr:DUF3048 domain-containing protein [Acidimicrobiales bacterium]
MGRRLFPGAAAVAAVAMLGASCGGGGGGASPVEAVGATPTEPAADVSTSSSALDTTTSTTVPVWPLTGAALSDPLGSNRAVVIAKIDNSPEARPHSGINQADVVYELKVEGITRFAAVFHSQEAEVVGPVRSARSSDPDLLANLNRPVLVWSGGNPGVVGEIHGAQDAGLLTDAGADVVPAEYWRDNSRVAPHNLYASTSGARRAVGQGTSPFPLFAHREAGEGAPAGATDLPGVSIDYGLGVVVDYVWDAERGCWDRFQSDARHSYANSAFVDADGRQVCPTNVAILSIEYGVSQVDARSPRAITTGGGDALVLVDGKAVHGSWSRANPGDPWTLTDDAGATIELVPGTTWVQLPEVGAPVTPMSPDAAAGLLAVRR